ncbi:hypothetical protein, partial [Streptosporangium sp. NPDC023615]|uniref:hypothetical protein n=1 Tax=Streptosporangium sp. NPDC023615 TaxID=3154794 RepID=UPI0034255419
NSNTGRRRPRTERKDDDTDVVEGDPVRQSLRAVRGGSGEGSRTLIAMNIHLSRLGVPFQQGEC